MWCKAWFHVIKSSWLLLKKLLLSIVIDSYATNIFQAKVLMNENEAQHFEKNCIKFIKRIRGHKSKGKIQKKVKYWRDLSNLSLPNLVKYRKKKKSIII